MSASMRKIYPKQDDVNKSCYQSLIGDKRQAAPVGLDIAYDLADIGTSPCLDSNATNDVFLLNLHIQQDS
eukprot:scaffold6333_cov61-Attheya_sp.AAC.4